MIGSVLKRVFGSANERIIKRLHQQVALINELEPEFEALSDDELKACSDKFRARLSNGEDLDDIRPEAFLD